MPPSTLHSFTTIAWAFLPTNLPRLTRVTADQSFSSVQTSSHATFFQIQTPLTNTLHHSQHDLTSSTDRHVESHPICKGARFGQDSERDLAIFGNLSHTTVEVRSRNPILPLGVHLVSRLHSNYHESAVDEAAKQQPQDWRRLRTLMNKRYKTYGTVILKATRQRSLRYRSPNSRYRRVRTSSSHALGSARLEAVTRRLICIDKRMDDQPRPGQQE